MKSQLLKATVVAVLSCFPHCILAQQPGPLPTILGLSEPLRTTYYPEAICVGCIWPEWDRGFLLQKYINKDHAVVAMYDAIGRRVLTGHISLPEFSRIWVIAVAAGHKGGIVVAAAGIMMDGTRRDFLAKTDDAGRTVQSVIIEHFSPLEVCETVDGNVWTFGGEHNARKLVVRRYSFEKGFISEFLDGDPDFAADDRGHFEKTYLHCGNDRVSVLLPRSGQYVEIDTTTGDLTRWKVDMSSAVGPASRGFAITEDGRVFVVFGNSDRVHQLYELCPVRGKPVATLTPIVGTLSRVDAAHLWGADGNDLIVKRQGDLWGVVSWVRLISSP